jgi:hypothetical protein
LELKVPKYQHTQKIWICHKKGKLKIKSLKLTIFSPTKATGGAKKFAVYVRTHWHCLEILEHIMHQGNVQLYKYIVQRKERV